MKLKFVIKFEHVGDNLIKYPLLSDHMAPVRLSVHSFFAVLLQLLDTLTEALYRYAITNGLSYNSMV